MSPVWYSRIINICVAVVLVSFFVYDKISGWQRTLVGVVGLLIPCILSLGIYLYNQHLLRKQRNNENEGIEGLEKLLDRIGGEIIDEINKREVIKLIKPEWREEFMECVKTGKASQELLEYLDTDAKGQEAVEIVLGIMGEKHEKLGTDLKGLLSKK